MASGIKPTASMYFLCFAIEVRCRHYIYLTSLDDSMLMQTKATQANMNMR